jgi:hypothetical protein
VNFRGPLLRRKRFEQGDEEWTENEPVHLVASNVEGEEVEVELRVGRGGVLYALPLDQSPEAEPPDLPPNEELHPVPPEALTTPFSVDDFS